MPRGRAGWGEGLLVEAGVAGGPPAAGARSGWSADRALDDLSLLAVCVAGDAGAVQAAGEGLLVEAGLTGRSLLLAPDLDGLRVKR